MKTKHMKVAVVQDHMGRVWTVVLASDLVAWFNATHEHRNWSLIGITKAKSQRQVINRLQDKQDCTVTITDLETA